MPRGGFIDRNLVGVRDKLKAKNESIKTNLKQSDSQSVGSPPKDELIPIQLPMEPAGVNEYSDTKTSDISHSEAQATIQDEICPSDKSAQIADKEFLKAQKERKNEYFRTKKFVLSKIENTLNLLPEKVQDLELEIREIESAKDRLLKARTSIFAINEKFWSDEDFFADMAEAIKTVENARLEYLSLAAKIPEIGEREEKSLPLKKEFALNEIMSMTTKQLFKLGLKFFSPLIIGVLLAAIIISVTILYSMGAL